MTARQPTWVFGYGSLIWKQDFPYTEARPCAINGWLRRFWQGSHDHRGVPQDPGRVVTLIESPGASCVGRAFLIEPDVFEYLDHREKNGYERVGVRIAFDAQSADGVAYVAPPDNPAFLGQASLGEMVRQINRCVGPSGSNRDYVIELARALRELGADDSHVFELEQFVLENAAL